jgi:hypothetical protein
MDHIDPKLQNKRNLTPVLDLDEMVIIYYENY